MLFINLDYLHKLLLMCPGTIETRHAYQKAIKSAYHDSQMEIEVR